MQRVEVLVDEESFAVQLAYERWADSDRADRKLAHAGYVAALEREAQSARVYADQTDWVRRMCATPPPTSRLQSDATPR
jgi:hypothetical protein